MSTIDSENISKPSNESQPKARRKPAKKAKATKKSPQAKKTVAKPKSDGTNKKAEVIAMMKRAKGATLAEIMAATGWQAHTVRGFVSILEGRGEDRVVQERRGGPDLQNREVNSQATLGPNAASGHQPGTAFLLGVAPSRPLVARVSDVTDPSRH